MRARACMCRRHASWQSLKLTSKDPCHTSRALNRQFVIMLFRYHSWILLFEIVEVAAAAAAVVVVVVVVVVVLVVVAGIVVIVVNVKVNVDLYSALS